MKLKLFDIFGISLTLVWLDVFGPTGLHVKCYIIGSTQVSLIVDVKWTVQVLYVAFLPTP